jgi:hypothetical protein
MAKVIKPKEKPKKPRASKYEEKIVINGTFDELVKELIIPNDKQKPTK